MSAAATTTTRNRISRLAEDGDLQLAEADRWLDAVDLVLLAALDGGETVTLEQAAEHALMAHARIRRLLALAVAA